MIFEGTILWLLVVCTILWWIPQNAQHEGAHALVVKALGGAITKFWPFPSRKFDGGFAFAYVRYWWPEGEPGDKHLGYISIAPLVANTAWLVGLVALRISYPEMGKVPATLLSALMLTNFADGATWLATYYRTQPKYSTDGWKLQVLWGLPVSDCRTTAVAWHLIFGSLVLLPVFLG